MKTEDFLLRVVALRDAQNRYTNKILSGELTDNVQEVIDLEKEIDDIISRLLTGEDKLEDNNNLKEIAINFKEYCKYVTQEREAVWSFDKGDMGIKEAISLETEAVNKQGELKGIINELLGIGKELE